MTISRGQMNRQLYQGGGIMSLSKEGIGGGDYKGIDMGSRVGYGLIKKVFRGAKKAVKGVTGAVKDIASSDIGKAALAGAALYYGGGGNLFGAQRAGMSGFSFGNLPGAGFFKNAVMPGTGESLARTSPFSKLFSKIPGGGVTAAIGGASVLAGLLTKAQMAEIDEVDPDERGDVVAEKLRQSLTRLGVSGEELERRVAEGVSEYTGYTSKAEGGRIGFAEGPILPNDSTQPVNPFGPKPGDFGIEEDIPIKMASNEISIDKIEMLIKRGADNDLIKEFTGASDGVIDQIRDAMQRKNKAGGGIMNRMNYALGDTASQNAMQAAGIEGLPVRQNPKGVKELDLRDNGGFIPPVGIKEKEDDIPAMLSNNEFVFTADAVRGMGDGDVELGAQRMYDQMKMLEKGGRV